MSDALREKSIFSLRNKVALVTGSLGLLGKQHCYALAEAGAHVVVTDVDCKACEEFAVALTDEYHVLSLGCDCRITDKLSIARTKEYVLDEFGHIDVLVNNAAINDMVEGHSAGGELSKFENFPVEAWNRSLEVNVTGTFLCCQILGPAMTEQGFGSIINIASTYALVAPDQSLYAGPDGTQSFYKSPAYPTTKGAVVALTRYLASYWGKHGVRVNALSPGGVKNGQNEFFIEKYSTRTPLGRMAYPNDYKGAVVFLASDASKYMTGANLVVDGGWTIW
ncbi:MAG TPA: SDR family oxidoreductase [Bacteroidota bacterium]|nr:SDR family oxidoreductase [Bacteroidota bacterium]